MNKKNDITGQETEGQDQIDWLRSTLADAKGSDRKFIITNHIYPGAKYTGKSKELLTDDFNN